MCFSFIFEDASNASLEYCGCEDCEEKYLANAQTYNILKA